MNEDELNRCEVVSKQLARDAGELIRAASKQEKRVNLKCSVADLVTETDQEVEKMLFRKLKEVFPTHEFIGEESVADGAKCDLTDSPTWVIDPIDGTTNFVHTFPYSCVSIGLMVNKKTEVAVVYNPSKNDMYSARPGKGAFCNDERIHVSTVKDISQALLCAEFGSQRDPKELDAKVRSMRNVINKAHGIRAMGSAAMNMCMVAHGYADGYYECGLHCWDIAAGHLIVREAGGFASSLNNVSGELDFMARNILVANSFELAQQIAQTVEFVPYERD